MNNLERYTIVSMPTHRVYVRDALLECESILYESEQLAQEAIDANNIDYDFELME